MIELMEHNKATYKELCEILKEHNKCALIQATGTGKSYIVGKYIEEHDYKTLILVPSNAIADAWQNLLSDIDKEIPIITYQTFYKNPNDYYDFDLVVADEMHHLGSEVWGRKFIDTYLQSESHKIIGLTATEIRYLDNQRDMAEEIFDNVKVNGCDLPTAINTGVLPTFKYVSALYCDESDFDKLKEKVGNISDIKIQNELKGKLDVCIKNMVSVKQAINENLTDEYKKIIVFLNNVMSKATALDMFKDVFPTANFYDVDYSKQKLQNNLQLEKFKSDIERAVLFAVDMLNEGIHVKGTDCIIMFRKTESPQIYLQQLGRGLSSDSQKMPIIFDFVGNEKLKIKSISESEEEKEERDVVSSLNKKLDKDKQIIFKTYLQDIKNVIGYINSFLINKPFTDEEIEYIKENYRTLGNKKIAEALNRSVGVVNNLAHSLGLTNKKTIEWSEEEISIVKNEYLEIGAKGIIEKYSFDKTQFQIVNMAKKLRIRKKENESWSEKEEEYIRENFETKSYEELVNELGRSKNSILQKAKRMGLVRTPRNFKKVYAFDKNGRFQKEFSTIAECARQLGVGQSSVKAAIKHNYPIDDIYYFHDKAFYIKEKTYSNKKVVKLDKNYNLIKTFDSVKEATKESGLATLCGVIGTKRENAIKETNFIWLYEEDYKKLKGSGEL